MRDDWGYVRLHAAEFEAQQREAAAWDLTLLQIKMLPETRDCPEEERTDG